MRILATTLSFALLLSSVPAAAQIQARATHSEGLTSTLPYSSRLRLAINGEVEIIHKLNERVKSGDRNLCVRYRGEDMSGCAKLLIRQTRVHSGEALRALLDLPVTAAKHDREKGYGDKQSGLLLADDILSIAESLKPQKFFAKTVRARGQRDRLEQASAQRRENAQLEGFRLQVLPPLDQHFAKTIQLATSGDAKAQVWEASKSSEIRGRLAQVRTRRWQIK